MINPSNPKFISTPKIKDGKVSASVSLEAGWNVLSIRPIDVNNQVLKARGDVYSLIYTFSDNLTGSCGSIDLESNDDGNSLFEISLKNFKANFNGAIETPAGFIFEVNTERGLIVCNLNINQKQYLCGCNLKIKANSFEDSLIYATNFVWGFLNNIVCKYNIPIYIKRIVIKNDVGEIALWALGHQPPVSWDTTLNYSNFNRIKLHAMSLKKEAISHYYSPGLMLHAFIKMYELAKTIKVQAERKNSPKVASMVANVFDKTFISPKGELISFAKGFEFLESTFRHPIAHGGLHFVSDFANIDNPQYFLETLKYLDQAKLMANTLFETIMSLPSDFDLKIQPSRKKKTLVDE